MKALIHATQIHRYGGTFIALLAFVFISSSAVLAQPSFSASTIDPSLGSTLLTDIQAYQERLKRLNLHTEEEHALILHRLLAANPIPQKADNYWQEQAGSRLTNSISALHNQQKTVAWVLLQLYGDQAKIMKAFSGIFRPLELEAPYLSSDDQLQLNEFRTKQMLAQIKMVDAANLFQPPTAAMQQAFLQEDEHSVLSPAGAFELDLRQSFIADKVRASGIELNEDKFRKTLRILKPTYDSEASAGDIYQRNNALVNLQENYDNDLPYSARGICCRGKYNSNGYVRGLIEAAGGTSTANFKRFYGGKYPVPKQEFD